MKKISLLLTTIMALGIFTSCNKTPEKKVEYLVKKIKKKLELNEGQKKQLNKIADQGLERFKEHKSKRSESIQEFKQLILSEKISENQVREIIQKRNDRKEKMINEFLPQVLEFHDSLTPEQKEKVTKFIDKMDKKFKKRWK